MLLLSLLAALALPALQPTYSAFAQTDGSVVSEEPPPTTDVPPTETPVPTDIPAPTEPPLPTAANTEPVPTIEPSATDEPVLPAETVEASATSTPFLNLQIGDRFVARTNVNCREGASTATSVVKLVLTGETGVVIESPQQIGSHNWMKVQLLDAATTQCYLAAQYVVLAEAGYGIPPTITSTPTITLTPSRTPTVTRTPTTRPTTNSHPHWFRDRYSDRDRHGNTDRNVDPN